MNVKLSFLGNYGFNLWSFNSRSFSVVRYGKNISVCFAFSLSGVFLIFVVTPPLIVSTCQTDREAVLNYAHHQHPLRITFSVFYEWSKHIM